MEFSHYRDSLEGFSNGYGITIILKRALFDWALEKDWAWFDIPVVFVWVIETKEIRKL